MKKQAFTYIITILIIALILISASFLLNSQKNNLILMRNLDDKIQAEVSAESMLNIAAADENFNESLKNLYFNRTGNIDPKLINQILADEKELNLNLDNSIEKDGFKLRSYVSFNDIEAAYEMYGTLINDVYKKQIPIINKNVVDEEDYLETVDSFNNIDKDSLSYIDYIFLDGKDYYIERDSSSFVIYENIEVLEDDELKLIKNIVKKGPLSKSVYLKQEGGSLTVNNQVRLRGILDIDQIITNQDLSLVGIYLHRNDLISDGSSIKVEGIAINMNESSENYIDSVYNFDKFKVFAKIIDNFIKPKIYSIQSS